MLAWLSIQGLALVESVELAFDPGLNVLTGETGAGKSLILGSIGLLLGERADVAWLRAGEPRGSVEGTFELSGRPDLVTALEATGIESEEGRLVLRREILPDGKSRAFANGRAVLVSQLKSAGDLLVDLHGQHEHQLLLRPDRQADFFDAWAGLWGERRALEADRTSLLEERRQLREMRLRWERECTEESVLREDYEELRAAAIDLEEEDRLKGERARQLHREHFLRGLMEARQAVSAEDAGAAAGVKRAAQALRALHALDAEALEIAAEAERILESVSDLESRLERAVGRLEEEPIDLEAVETRLEWLHRLKRKHRVDLAGLLALRDTLGSRVEGFDPAGRDVEMLEREHDDRLQAFERRLDALMTHRSDRFAAFEEDIGARLTRLGFGRAVLRVRAAEGDRGRAAIDPTAIPTLEFAFQPNEGEPERSLRRIASGGELSRVMLAIKSLMVERDQVAVMVFDEVDQGIGGAVGEEVGRLLQTLGAGRQVLCITHLPLIAAHGNAHFQVAKAMRGGRTATTVRLLSPEEREAEVARLLAGNRVTTTTRTQARELIEATRGGAAAPREDAPVRRVRRAGSKRS